MKPDTKLSQLRALMGAGEWEKAIAFAARFPRLGEHRNAILDAKDAIAHPSFMAQIGKNPAVVRAAGIAALRERWPLDDAA